MLRIGTLTLALRNTFRQRARTLLTLSVIVSGVAATILVGGFVEDVFFQLREATIHSQLGHIQIYREGYRQYGASAPGKYLIDDPALIISAAERLDNVDEAMARLSFTGVINNGRSDFAIVGEGLEADKEAHLGTFVTITAGRQLTDRDSFGMLIGEGVAHATKLGPGDHATLVLSTPEGAINSLDFDVIGVFRTFSKDYDARAVRVLLPAAQELFSVHSVNAVVVVLKRTKATDTVAASLRAQLDPKRYDIRTWPELADFYGKTVALYRRQFAVLQGIILVAVLLSVANSVNVTVFERTGEFGTLRALGNRQRDVFRLIVTENLLLGLAGGVAGCALGAALAWIVSAFGIPMPPPPNSELGYIAQVRVSIGDLVTGLAIGVVATTLASLLPARRAMRIPVVDALRQN